MRRDCICERIEEFGCCEAQAGGRETGRGGWGLRGVTVAEGGLLLGLAGNRFAENQGPGMPGMGGLGGCLQRALSVWDAGGPKGGCVWEVD